MKFCTTEVFCVFVKMFDDHAHGFICCNSIFFILLRTCADYTNSLIIQHIVTNQPHRSFTEYQQIVVNRLHL